MRIVRTSILSGVTRERDLTVSEAQIIELFFPPDLRRPIQDIFPELSAEDREFLKTGITAEEWDAAFPEPDKG